MLCCSFFCVFFPHLDRYEFRVILAAFWRFFASSSVRRIGCVAAWYGPSPPAPLPRDGAVAADPFGSDDGLAEPPVLRSRGPRRAALTYAADGGACHFCAILGEGGNISKRQMSLLATNFGANRADRFNGSRGRSEGRLGRRPSGRADTWVGPYGGELRTTGRIAMNPYRSSRVRQGGRRGDGASAGDVGMQYPSLRSG
jgi:hypothetical protein